MHPSDPATLCDVDHGGEERRSGARCALLQGWLNRLATALNALLDRCAPLGYEDECGFHYGRPQTDHYGRP